MNVYQLLAIIKQLEAEQNPANDYLLQFYTDMYHCELKMIADKVAIELDKKPITKYWLEFLAK